MPHLLTLRYLMILTSPSLTVFTDFVTVLLLYTVTISPDSCNSITQIEWLEQQTFFSHSLEAMRSKIKAVADMVSAESSLPGLQMAPFSLLALSSPPSISLILLFSISIFVKNAVQVFCGFPIHSCFLMTRWESRIWGKKSPPMKTPPCITPGDRRSQGLP